MNRTQVIVATCGGVGCCPIASGTAGTLAAVPLVLLLWSSGSWVTHVAAVIIVAALGLWAARGAEERWGRTDPGQVVIDEVAGYLVATAFAPPSWLALAASFFLFRALDVLKPFPARRLERLPGAWGIMADDVMAGVYANAALQIGLALAQAGGWRG